MSGWLLSYLIVILDKEVHLRASTCIDGGQSNSHDPKESTLSDCWACEVRSEEQSIRATSSSPRRFSMRLNLLILRSSVSLDDRQSRHATSTRPHPEQPHSASIRLIFLQATISTLSVHFGSSPLSLSPSGCPLRRQSSCSSFHTTGIPGQLEAEFMTAFAYAISALPEGAIITGSTASSNLALLNRIL